MSSTERPDPWPSSADDDTGPLDPEPLRAARPSGPWPGQHYTALDLTPELLRVDHRPAILKNPMLLRGGIAAAVVAVISGLVFWLLRPTPDAPGPPSVSPTTAATSDSRPQDPKANARLMRLLPRGYPAGACQPVDPPEGASAKADCKKNADPNGPPSASYLLAPDKAALETAFDDTVGDFTVVNCPGNIQSPGPWRRNATPQRISGTLICGFQQTRPTVAWTAEADLLLSSVRADKAGPNLDQLYAWWSTHS